MTPTLTATDFLQQLDARIAKYDLLCHPFYKAWAAGELTRDDLREYARDYYHHVEAFPSYLAGLAMRLDDGELRRVVLANMQEELGGAPAKLGRNHADIWLDFAEGMGANRDQRGHKPVSEVSGLVAHFQGVASEGTPAEALAAFYAYESQVPRVATEKERGLRVMYNAGDQTCGYFTLHATADVYHANAWRGQLEKQVAVHPKTAEAALNAAEAAALKLWEALDGIEARRVARAA
jgi:pyrroloquinoline-quinone synthase